MDHTRPLHCCGCGFHWVQAVYRRVKENGLRSAYVHQLGVRMYIRELMALPNLPATHIEPAFMKLKVRCPDDDRLKRILQYMQRTWIVSSSRPPASWSTFKRSLRTNNDAEGWHSRLNHHAPHDRIEQLSASEDTARGSIAAASTSATRTAEKAVQAPQQKQQDQTSKAEGAVVRIRAH